MILKLLEMLHFTDQKDNQQHSHRIHPHHNSIKNNSISFKRFENLGYKLNPTRIEQSTMVKVTDKELGAPSDLFPNGLTMFYNPNQQSDITRSDATVLGDIIG
jgi:hypothetical protein